MKQFNLIKVKVIVIKDSEHLCKSEVWSHNAFKLRVLSRYHAADKASSVTVSFFYAKRLWEYFCKTIYYIMCWCLF